MSYSDGRPAGTRPRLTTLVVIGVLETITLAVLLINLATQHNQQVAQAIGPVHGLLYLVGIALTWVATKQVRARLLAFVPVAGPLLSAWSVRRERAEPSA